MANLRDNIPFPSGVNSGSVAANEALGRAFMADLSYLPRSINGLAGGDYDPYSSRAYAKALLPGIAGVPVMRIIDGAHALAEGLQPRKLQKEQSPVVPDPPPEASTPTSSVPTLNGLVYYLSDYPSLTVAQSIRNQASTLPPVSRPQYYQSLITDLEGNGTITGGEIRREAQRLLQSLTPPSAPLVGVELNPGPGGKGKKNKKKSKNQVTVVQPSKKAKQTTAPLPISRSLTQSLSYGSARFQSMRGVRVVGSHRVCDLTAATVTGAVTFTNGATGSSFLANSYAIRPVYLGLPLSDVAKDFFRWRFTRLRFEYCPTSATTNSGGIALGFSADGYAAVAPTKAQITTLDKSCEFAPFARCEVDCSSEVDPSYLRYTYESAAGAAEDRWDECGTLFCAGTITPVPAATLECGALWVHYSLELFLSGDVTNVQLNTKSLKGLRRVLAKRLFDLDRELNRRLTLDSKEPELDPDSQFDFQPEAPTHDDEKDIHPGSSFVSPSSSSLKHTISILGAPKR